MLTRLQVKFNWQKFTNYQKNRLKKGYLNLFTFTIGESHYNRLFKISTKVCSVISFSSYPFHTDTSQRKSVGRFLYNTSPNWKILSNRSYYYLPGTAKTSQTNPPITKKQRLESVKSCDKDSLSRRCSSPISITVVNEKYNNTNEKKYNAHV